MVTPISIENQELAKELKFEYFFGGQFAGGAERQYKCEYRGLTLLQILWTPKNKKSGKWGTGKMAYEIQGEKKVYEDINEFLSAVRERFSMKII